MSLLNKPSLFLSISLFSCFCASTTLSLSPSDSSSTFSNSVKSPPPSYASSNLNSVTSSYFSKHRLASKQINNVVNNNNSASGVRFLTSPNGLQTDDVINPLPDLHPSASVSYEPKGTTEDGPWRRPKRSPERWRSFREEGDLWDHERENMQARQTMKEVEDLKKKEEEAGEERPQRDGPFPSSSSFSSSSSSFSSSDIQSPHDLLRHQRKELELFLWNQHSKDLRDERARARGEKKDKEDVKDKVESERDGNKEDFGLKTYLDLQARWEDEDLLKEGRAWEVEVGKEKVEEKIEEEKSTDDDYNVDDYANVGDDDDDDYGIEEYLDSYQYDYDDEEGDEEEGEEEEEEEEEEDEEKRGGLIGTDNLNEEETTKVFGFDQIDWEEPVLEEAGRSPQGWQGVKKKEKEKEEEDSGWERKEEKMETTEKNPPHIIFIVVDDLGYNDVPWHNPEVEAPNLEQLSREGTVLENHYVLPVCTPSRSALLSGVYPFRYGRQMGMVRPLSPTGLNTSLVLLPQHLQELGYRTHLIGKWHLGYCHPAYTPTYRGFDSFYGFYLGSQTYYSHFRSTSGRQRLFGSVEGQDVEVAEQQLKKEKTKAKEWRERLQDSRAKEFKKTKVQERGFVNPRNQEKKSSKVPNRLKTHNNHDSRSWDAFPASSRSRRSSSSFFPSSSSKNSKKFVNGRPEWKKKWTETKMKEHLLWRTTKSKIEELLREKESAKLADGLQTRRKIEMRMRGGHDFRSNEEPLTNVTGIYSTHLFSNRATQLINDHARLYRHPKQSFSTYDRPTLPLGNLEDDQEKNPQSSKEYPFRNYYLFDKSNKDTLQPDENFEFLKRSSGRDTSERVFDSMKPLPYENPRDEFGETPRESSVPPMFLMLSFQAVHSPLQVPPKYKKKFMHIPNRARRQFLGMVAAMDEAVGKVVDALKSNNMYENSVIVFTSDNGGSVSSGGNNFPLRGSKGGLFEGGTRGVAFIHSPLLKQKGQKYYGLMHAVDWYDTLLHVAEGRHQTNHQSPDRSQSKVHPFTSSRDKKPFRHQSRDDTKSRNPSWNKSQTHLQKHRYKKQQPKNSEKYPHKTHEKKITSSYSKKGSMEARGKQVARRRSWLDKELASTKNVRERDYKPQIKSKPFESVFGSRYTEWDSRHQESSRENLHGESSRKKMHHNAKEKIKEKQRSVFSTQWKPRQRENDRKHLLQKEEDISEQGRKEREVEEQQQQQPESKGKRNYDDWSPYYNDNADVVPQEQPLDAWETVDNYEEKMKKKEGKEEKIRTWRDIVDNEDAEKGKLWIWWKTFMAEEEGREGRLKREIQENLKEEETQSQVTHTPTKQGYVEEALNEEDGEQDDHRIYLGLGINKKGTNSKKSRLTAMMASVRQKEREEKEENEKEKNKEDEIKEKEFEEDEDDNEKEEEELMEGEQELEEEKEESDEEEEEELEEEEEKLKLEEEEDEDPGSYKRIVKRNKRDTKDFYEYMRNKADRQRGYQTDSYDMWSVLSNNQPSPRSTFVYNVRKGPLKGALRHRHWKLIVGTGGRLDGWIPPEDVRNDRGRLGPSWLSKQPHNKNILLFNLKSDPLETTDVSEDHPEVVKRLRKILRSYAKESQKPHAPEDDPRGHPSLFGGFFSTGWCEPVV